MRRHPKSILVAIVAAIAFGLAGAATCARADAPSTPPPPPPPDLAAIGASPEQAARVRDILKAGRERMRAAREATHAELAQVLSPEQLGRLEAMLPPAPPPPPRPPRESENRTELPLRR